MSGQSTNAKRIRISVDVPLDLRWQLKQIASAKKMFFKDYLQDVFAREAKRQDARETASSSN